LGDATTRDAAASSNHRGRATAPCIADLPRQVRPIGRAANHERHGSPVMIVLTVNGQRHELDIEPETPLLWVLRDELGLTGTKYGCGIAQCGACTVHVGGAATRSCSMAVSDAANQDIVTIEGLSADGTHPVQKAWLAEDVPQCGYCQSGQIMAAAAFLKDKPNPTDADIDDGITNICRCGTYPRLRAAIHRAAALMKA
jgi:isoquinoline 1-oxidoreductase alpha subunit